MIETGAMNDNEIVVKQGAREGRSACFSRRPRTRPTSRRRSIPGLKPIVAAACRGDTAKCVTLPAKPNAKPGRQAGGTTPAPAQARAAPVRAARNRRADRGDARHRAGRAATVARPGAHRARRCSAPAPPPKRSAHNKLRAGLTSLGILFGVASVIAMLAIGNGAEQEILEQMKLLGANNIVITPIVEQKEGKVDNDDGEEGSRSASRPGLTYLDAEAIRDVDPRRRRHEQRGRRQQRDHARRAPPLGQDRRRRLELLPRDEPASSPRARSFALAALRDGGAGDDHRPGREVALLHDRGSDRPADQGRQRVAHRRRRARGPQGLRRDGAAARHSRREHGRLRAAADDAAALPQSRRGDAAGDGARRARRTAAPTTDSTRDRRPARREAQLSPARQGDRAGRQVDAP